MSYTKNPDDEDYRLALGDFFNSSTGRFTSDLKESLYGGNLELVKELNGSSIKTDLKAGFFLQNRDRSFLSRNFVYNGRQPSGLVFNPQQDLAADNMAEPGFIW